MLLVETGFMSYWIGHIELPSALLVYLPPELWFKVLEFSAPDLPTPSARVMRDFIDEIEKEIVDEIDKCKAQHPEYSLEQTIEHVFDDSWGEDLLVDYTHNNCMIPFVDALLRRMYGIMLPEW